MAGTISQTTNPYGNIFAPAKTQITNSTNGNTVDVNDPYGILAASGALQPNFDSEAQDLTDSASQYDQGFNQLRSDALRQGPSNALSMALYSNSLQANNMRQKGMAQNDANTAAAEDNLAASGGMSSGARERVQEQGQKNYMSMAQGVDQDQIQGNLQAQQQGMATQNQQLGELTQDENAKSSQWLAAKNTDYQNQLSIYQTQMQGIAAEDQAEATENSGGKK